MEKIERRKQKRYTSRFAVEYSFSKLTSSKKMRKLGELAYSTSTSKEGLLLYTKKKLQVDDTIVITISLPFREKFDEISLTGKVIWAKTKSELTDIPNDFGNFKYCCGIHLLESGEIKEMEKFIEYWKKYRPTDNHEQ